MPSSNPSEAFRTYWPVRTWFLNDKVTCHVKATSTETCPNCSAVLVTDDITIGWTIICANCRTPFQYQAEQVKTVTSRKAIASLVLGLSSLFAACLTGIPAVILGILALRDIRRSKQDMAGS